jgi:hypothetical protein
MDIDAHLPAGGILHVHYEKDGRVHGVDLSQAGEPEISITEVHRLVH